MPSVVTLPISSNAVVALVCGILAVFMWPLSIVLGPIAWFAAAKVDGEIERGEVAVNSRALALAGKVCGIVGLAFIIIFMVIWVVIVLVMLAAPGGF